MKIMGISGLPGSGKSLISEIASKKGAIIVGMGDIVREESIKRNEDSKTTAINLRKEYGQYIIAELTIDKITQIIKEDPDKTIIVEGIRSPYEVNLFKDNFKDFIIVSVFANPSIRFKRLKKRKRSDDSSNFKEFQNRDKRELTFGIGEVIATSDKLIINEKDLKSYEKEINEFLKENIGI